MNNQVVMFSITDVVAALWRRKSTIVLVTLIFAGTATYIAYQMSPIFVAQGQVVVRSAGAIAPDPDHSFYSAVVSDAVISTERDVIGSVGLASRVSDSIDMPPPPESMTRRALRRILPPIVHGLHLPESWLASLAPPPQTEDGKIAEVQRALSTASDKGSSVINLYAATTDPVLSAEIANKALTLYMDGRVVAQRTSAANVATALRERLQQTSSEIDRVENRIASMMQRPGMIENAEVPSASREVTLIGTRLAEARGDLASKRAAADAAARLQQSARGNSAQLVALLDQGSASTAEIRRQLAQAQADASRIQAEVGSKHPRYIAAKITLDSVAANVVGDANRIVAQRQAEAAAAAEVVASLSSQLGDLQKRSSNMGPAVLNVDRERENLANLRKISGTIEDRLIGLTAQPLDPNAQVLTWAKPPQMAASPQKVLFTAGGVLIGLVASCAGVLIGEYRSRLRRDTYMPVASLPGPMLGSLPRLRNGRVTTSASSAFQAIALEIDYLAVENKQKVFAITSGLPDEGKTTVTVHLALALSRLGRRVLVINCDLHGKPQTEWTARQAAPSGEGGLPGVTIPDGTDLHVIPALDGGPDPVTFLNSTRFRNILKSARSAYDIVICDTPPILSVPDAVVVGRASDAVLLVSASDNMTREQVAGEVSRRVAAIGRPVCGVIVTKADTQEASYTSYAGYARRRNVSSIMGAIASTREG